jgi:cystathionine beta-lyase
MYAYVRENIRFTKEYVKEKLPGVTMAEHEGTYMVWLDFRDTGLDTEQLENLIIKDAKLWLDSGKIFGDSGRGFQRINVACPRKVLEEALNRLKTALQHANKSFKLNGGKTV